MGTKANNLETTIAGSENNTTWAKMGRLYRSIPVLKYIDPLVFPVLIFVGFFIYVLFFVPYKEPVCTCDQRIYDEELREIGMKGDIQVQNYLNQIDNQVNCEARREALIKDLKQRKKIR